MSSGRRCLTLVVALLAVGAIAPRARGDELREDVFLCEDAVARAMSCCPASFQMPTATYCDFRDGCSGSPHDPEITMAQARCVIGATCDDLRSDKCGVPLPCP